MGVIAREHDGVRGCIQLQRVTGRDKRCEIAQGSTAGRDAP